MYRIATIPDVHGNIYALNAVLKDINEKSVDFVYCLGDMIGIGPYSNEVLDALFSLNNIQMLTGNHDELVLAVLNNEPYPKSRINVIPHHQWIAERLHKKYITELEKLPRIINTTIYEQSLHLIHYPMNTTLYDEHISRDPFDLTGMPSPKNFSELDGLRDFSLVCFGHDHGNHLVSCSNKTFFNSGSVGCFNEPYARYGIIDIDEKGFYIQQQYVPYDYKSYVDELRKSSMPRRDIILGIYE